MRSLSIRELESMLAEGKTLALYVYSESKKDTLRELFDTQVVVPELERAFDSKVEFYSINADEHPEILRRYKLPSLVLFKGGVEVSKLEGIKAWNEYVEALSCL